MVILSKTYRQFGVLLLGALLSFSSVVAQADTKQPTPDSSQASASGGDNSRPMLVPPAPNIDAAGYVLMDANSGKILAAKNPDKKRAPASLTKLMTLYVISQAVADGQIKLDDKVRISKKAWSTGGSRMFVKEGELVPVGDLVEGIIVDSGNDATVAMAEYLGGTEETFVTMMNKEAQSLGMKNTHYTDSNGLPHPNHYSTPMDIAILARHIINDYPEFYEKDRWYAKKELTHNGIKQYNRNRLLFRDPAVDGLKTGHTKEAGYCLVTSAKKDGMRLISVVMGAPSDSARADDSQRLLTYGFRFYRTYKVYAANEAISNPRVWGGQKKNIPAGLNKDLYITVPVGEYKKLKATTTISEALEAPVQKGQELGMLQIKYQDKVIAEQPIVALAEDLEGGIWTRFTDHISRSYHNWFKGGKKEG